MESRVVQVPMRSAPGQSHSRAANGFATRTHYLHAQAAVFLFAILSLSVLPVGLSVGGILSSIFAANPSLGRANAGGGAKHHESRDRKRNDFSKHDLPLSQIPI